MSSFQERLDAIQQRISDACARSGRAIDEVTLVAVSKGQPVQAIAEAMQEGLRVFGENYVQELMFKANALNDEAQGTQWRFIGHLQTNKAKHVVSVADVVETVDSLGLAQELSKRAQAASRSIEVLVQVNIGRESQKGGCSIETAPELVQALRALPSLVVKGLMAIPPANESPEASRRYFAQLRALGNSVGVQQLSMGMSHDFEVAIEEGATHVRIGTALFGPRA